MVTARPISAWAAVAPRATARQRVDEIQLLFKPPGAGLDLGVVGFLWRRRLPRGSILKCLTALVMYTSRGRCRPRGAPGRTSVPPVRRTGGPRGLPVPGCSPTNITGAWEGPSPNTVCVASPATTGSAGNSPRPCAPRSGCGSRRSRLRLSEAKTGPARARLAIHARLSAIAGTFWLAYVLVMFSIRRTGQARARRKPQQEKPFRMDYRNLGRSGVKVSPSASAP